MLVYRANYIAKTGPSNYTCQIIRMSVYRVSDCHTFTPHTKLYSSLLAWIRSDGSEKNEHFRPKHVKEC